MERIGGYFAAGLGQVVGFLPNLLSALVIVVIGYALSRVAATIVRKVLARVGFDRFVAGRVHPAASATGSPASMLGSAVFWLGILVTASMASDSLRLYALAAGINKILAFVPNLIVAGVILAVAAGLARVTSRLVANVTVARVTRAGIMAIAVFMALDQIGIARNIVLVTFVALLGAAAVAAAVAFGIGNIPVAREYTQRWVSRGREKIEEGNRPASSPPAASYEDEPFDTRH